MLYGEFLQLAAFIQTDSILISDGKMSKWMITVGKWFDDICNWKNPITKVLVHSEVPRCQMFSPEATEFICVLHVLESNTSNKEWDELNAICLKENTSALKLIAN